MTIVYILKVLYTFFVIMYVVITRDEVFLFGVS